MRSTTRTRRVVCLFTLLLLAASVGTAYYYYRRYQAAQAIIDNPQAAAQVEIASLTSQLGQLMVLPVDEEPTVATVLDKEKVRDQPFFKNAENGDKVVIYTKAMKAILYRPSQAKIIEVAPIQINQPASSQTTQAVAEEEPTPIPTQGENTENAGE